LAVAGYRGESRGCNSFILETVDEVFDARRSGIAGEDHTDEAATFDARLRSLLQTRFG
jgi:hypothetical protein